MDGASLKHHVVKPSADVGQILDPVAGTSIFECAHCGKKFNLADQAGIYSLKNGICEGKEDGQ